MRKYSPLGKYLVKQPEVSIALTFQEIEQLLGFHLPHSAYNHRAWWANSLSHPQAYSWLNVGWKVNKVDLKKKTTFFIRPLILSIHKSIENKEAISLSLTMDNEHLAFILSNPYASATAVYSWRQIIQILIDVNPHIFGNITNQPDHHVFPDMLAKLGYTVINWKTGESWKGKENKGIADLDTVATNTKNSNLN